MGRPLQAQDATYVRSRADRRAQRHAQAEAAILSRCGRHL